MNIQNAHTDLDRFRQLLVQQCTVIKAIVRKGAGVTGCGADLAKAHRSPLSWKADILASLGLEWVTKLYKN